MLMQYLGLSLEQGQNMEDVGMRARSDWAVSFVFSVLLFYLQPTDARVSTFSVFLVAEG